MAHTEDNVEAQLNWQPCALYYYLYVTITTTMARHFTENCAPTAAATTTNIFCAAAA